MKVESRGRLFFLYQFPAIFWAIVIFILSSIPGRKFPHILFPQIDKIAHALIFFLFCLFTDRALRHQSILPDVARYALPISVFLTLVYGITDEFHQFFIPGRTPDLLDLAADTFGALLFAAARMVWKRVR